MLANDLNLHTIEWKQRVEHFDPETKEWKLLATQEAGWSEAGAWYIKLEQATENADGSPAGAVRVESGSRDGIVERTFLPDDSSGSIQPAELNRWWLPSPLLALGRMVGAGRMARLGELLLESPDLRITSRSPDGRYATIQGTLLTGGSVVLAEVRVDSAQSFVPTSWVLRDALSNIPIETVEVQEVSRIEGVVVPTRAVRHTYRIADSVDPAQMARLDDEVRARGVDPMRRDPTKAEVREAYAAAVAKAFGAKGIPYSEVWHAQRLALVTDLKVNAPFPLERCDTPFPGHATWADLVRFQNPRGEPIEDPDRRGHE
ncbi:MAG: hypothetical protein DYG92_13285 [Leptolyngbya sp. PLA1]|nr:hypothetical protein [Leptolyngbya sp. PLA1]